jgi:hypothetical protein
MIVRERVHHPHVPHHPFNPVHDCEPRYTLPHNTTPLCYPPSHTRSVAPMKRWMHLSKRPPVSRPMLQVQRTPVAGKVLTYDSRGTQVRCDTRWPAHIPACQNFVRDRLSFIRAVSVFQMLMVDHRVWFHARCCNGPAGTLLDE